MTAADKIEAEEQKLSDKLIELDEALIDVTNRTQKLSVSVDNLESKYIKY